MADEPLSAGTETVATGLLILTGNVWTPGFASFVGQPLMTRPPWLLCLIFLLHLLILACISYYTPDSADKTVHQNEGNFIPTRYSELIDVFSKAMAEALSPHHSVDHAIDLQLGMNKPYWQINHLLDVKLQTLITYTKSIQTCNLV